MPSMKSIKRRISSVKTTRKIMKAMNMVAASKLQRNKNRLEKAEPFAQESRRILKIIQECEVKDNIFFQRREEGNSAYLVITNDRGLCGNYNSNLTEKTLQHIEAGRSEMLIIAGVKGYEYFKRRDKKIIERFDDVAETAFYEDAQRMADFLLSLYSSGAVKEAFLCYTEFESVLSSNALVERILPIELKPAENRNKYNKMKYEPDVDVFLQAAIPRYISSAIYLAFLQSSASEQAARMLSMDTAVNNASDIISNLTSTYNRRRQAAITQEISEIIGNTNV